MELSTVLWSTFVNPIPAKPNRSSVTVWQFLASIALQTLGPFWASVSGEVFESPYTYSRAHVSHQHATRVYNTEKGPRRHSGTVGCCATNGPSQQVQNDSPQVSLCSQSHAGVENFTDNTLEELKAESYSGHTWKTDQYSAHTVCLDQSWHLMDKKVVFDCAFKVQAVQKYDCYLL